MCEIVYCREKKSTYSLKIPHICDILICHTVLYSCTVTITIHAYLNSWYKTVYLFVNIFFDLRLTFWALGMFIGMFIGNVYWHVYWRWTGLKMRVTLILHPCEQTRKSSIVTWPDFSVFSRQISKNISYKPVLAHMYMSITNVKKPATQHVNDYQD